MEKKTLHEADVISFAEYRGEMTWAVLKQVEAYWEGLRNGGAVPMRSALNPRGIENALEYAFVLERIAPGLARFRLAGMHLVDLIGMEVRGMPLTSFFVPDSRKRAGEILEQVFQGPEITELHLEGESGFGKPELKARMLLLPMKSDLGDVTRVLGCLVSEGTIGRAPRRFELKEARRRLVNTGQQAAGTPRPASEPVKAPEGQSATHRDMNKLLGASPPDRPAKGFSESRSPYAQKPKSRRSAHLYLVESSD